jgi:hypothetical protein
MARDLSAAVLTEAVPTTGLGNVARRVALTSASVTCQLVVTGDTPAHVLGGRAVEKCEWRTPEGVSLLLADVDIGVVDSCIAGLAVHEAVARKVAVVA